VRCSILLRVNCPAPICVNYAEIGDLVFLKYYMMNLQNSQLLKRYFSKQNALFVGHVCVYTLRPRSCFAFKVQILIVLLIFVAMEFLSPYLRKRVCLFRRYWGFSLTTYILTSDKIFYLHHKTSFLVFLFTLHIAPLFFINNEIHNYLLYFLLFLFQFSLMNWQFCLFNGVISTFSKLLCCNLVMRMNEVGKTIKRRFS
jgi:hypothetical protein